MSEKRPKPRACGPVRCRIVRGPRKDGRWYWRGDLYENAGCKTIWTGWGTIKEVDLAVAAIVARDGLDQPRGDDRADTVAELMGYWLAAQRKRADLRPRTVGGAQTIARRLVRDLGSYRLDRLDQAALEDYRDRSLRAGVAPRTVALALSGLAQAWRYGIRTGLHALDPLPHVRIRIEDRQLRRTPTAGDVAAVLARLEGWPRLALLLLFATGARIGEVGALRWEDVDLEAGTVTLRGKTGERTVPIHHQVLAELAEAPRRGSYVLGIEPVTVHGLRYHLDTACYRAEVPRWTPHGLRRAACDQLYRAGVDVGTAAALLGHSPQVALRYYRRATEADMRDAVAKSRLGVLPAGDVIPIGRGRL